MPATRSAQKAMKKTPYTKPGATVSTSASLSPKLLPLTMGPGKWVNKSTMAIDDTLQTPKPAKV